MTKTAKNVQAFIKLHANKVYGEEIYSTFGTLHTEKVNRGSYINPVVGHANRFSCVGHYVTSYIKKNPEKFTIIADSLGAVIFEVK